MSGSSKEIGPESRARIRNDSESLLRTRTRRAARTVVAQGATSPFRAALISGQLTEESAFQKSPAATAATGGAAMAPSFPEAARLPPIGPTPPEVPPVAYDMDAPPGPWPAPPEFGALPLMPLPANGT